jgi:hypothetical protein
LLWLYDCFIVVWLPQGMGLEEAAYLLYMVSFVEICRGEAS